MVRHRGNGYGQIPGYRVALIVLHISATQSNVPRFTPRRSTGRSARNRNPMKTRPSAATSSSHCNLVGLIDPLSSNLLPGG
jgi:hypothetical protein